MPNAAMPRFVRGDVDGFFGLALDNLVQLLVIDALCRTVLGFDDALIYGRVFPGVALSLLVGNLWYARMARQLSQREGRSDVCALPYGINTVSLFAHVFLVMLPAKLAAEAAGAGDPSAVAWRAGLWACLGSGLIEFSGAYLAERVRKLTPRAALLSTLAGIAIGFISIGFLLRTFAHPLVGLPVLGVVLLTYFGRVKFKGNLPAGLVAVGLGVAIAWTTGLAPAGQAPNAAGFHMPVPVVGDLLEPLLTGEALAYIGIIVPMGLFNLLGSLQNIESADAAGDLYPTAPALAVNGLGTMAAALFGSCFPTTIYIGHPGWKAMGARAGYSVLNGIFMTAICLTGTVGLLAWAVPVDAAMAIVLWIGLVISAQAFQTVPRAHAPAVVVGLMPGIAAWGTLMAKNGLRAAGVGAPGGAPFDPALIPAFQAVDTYIHGAFALEQGFIFTAMLLAATTVALIERQFSRAAIWCGLGAVLSATGLMHGYAFTPGDTVLALGPAWPWSIGYATMAAVFVTAQWTTRPSPGDAEH